MKKCLCGLLSLFLLVGCSASSAPTQNAKSVAAGTADAQTQSGQTRPEREPTSTEENAFDESDIDEFLRVLEESGYSYWAISQIPTDQYLRSHVVNKDTYSVPLTLVSIATWAKGNASAYASAEEMRQASRDLYGVECSLENAFKENGMYAIPPHGPTHSVELVPDTVEIVGDTISIHSLVTYWWYEEGEQGSYTYKHTFTKNPEGSLFPYRLQSLLQVSSTYPIVDENVAHPANIYNVPLLALVNVEELNVRQGPGTDYEKVTLLLLDTLLYIVGDDGGEWLCTGYGWVKAEYVTILGAVE